VSAAGGIRHAPARGKAVGANAIQVFTKTPNQWREPSVTDEQGEDFQSELRRHGIRAVVAHDSYLINLASPDPRLRRRSVEAFIGELTRCRTLGIPWIVTHPGNFMDDRQAGLARNVTAYTDCLEAVDGPAILIETTAGSGTALGSTFEELAALRAGIPEGLRERVGFCADTAHLHAADHDLHETEPDVWTLFDRTIGLGHLRCLHLNDSRAPKGSRRDRHEWIAEGTIGAGPFRRIMTDPRLQDSIKIIETPKADDPERHDRRMLRRLRAYARSPRRGTR
jgi:deoxyribonuclease-4